MKLIWTLGLSLVAGASALGQAAVPQEVPAVGAAGQPVPDTPHVYRVGGGVKAPVPISMPDPDFSEKERRKKISGAVLVGLIVDAEGKPQQVHVKRSIADQVGKKDLKAALSLDAKAIEAVKQYRFKPAMRDGQSVPVEMNVEVKFQIF